MFHDSDGEAGQWHVEVQAHVHEAAAPVHRKVGAHGASLPRDLPALVVDAERRIEPARLDDRRIPARDVAHPFDRLAVPETEPAGAEGLPDLQDVHAPGRGLMI